MISIVTINKNNKQGLEDTINSIVNQTCFKEVEYIVVDGCSTDGSQNVIETYKEYITKVIYENTGSLYEAMNIGTQNCSCEYILYLNSGDTLIDSNTLNEALSIIDNNYDMYIFNQKSIGFNGVSYVYKSQDSKFTNPRNLFMCHETCPHQSTIIRRSVALQFPYDNTYKISSDVKFFTETLLYNNKSFVIHPEIVLSVFKHDGISKLKKRLKACEKYNIFNQLTEKYWPEHIVNGRINKYKSIATEERTDDIPITIDFVFPYLDNTDINWQKQLKETSEQCGRKFDVNGERYRDWGLLKYYFRGLETNMSFINKVFMIVSEISQVPEWLDVNKVNIVLHKDFIPGQHLPTFNSSTIEMFLGNINGLSDYFIYGNDDMYPISRMYKSDFIEPINDKLRFKCHNRNREKCKTDYNVWLRNSDDFVRKDLSIDQGKNFLVPEHTYAPMYLPDIRNFYNTHSDEINSSCTTFRNNNNMTQQLWNYYQYHKGNCSGTYTLMPLYVSTTSEMLPNIIVNTDSDILCMNDTEHCTIDLFNKTKQKIIDAFEQRFPNKSKYEV